MKYLIRFSIICAMLLIGGSAYAAQISIGISIGPPPAHRVFHVRPDRPGLDFVWIEGYWDLVGNHYRWIDGYWARPPYYGSFWVSPRYEGRRYYRGYWEHDNRWSDRDRDRDRYSNREHYRDYDRDRRNRDWERDRNKDKDRDRDRDRGRNKDKDKDRDRGNDSNRWGYRN